MLAIYINEAGQVIVLNYEIKWWGSSRIHKFLGCLGGSVGLASNFGSGHDLTVCEVEPRVRLCADSLEPGACFRSIVCLPLSQKMNKH